MYFQGKTYLQSPRQELTEAQKDVIAQEWKVFKTDTERRIDKIENRITELKVQLKTSGNTIDNAYGKSIDALEQQNKDLRARMVTYEGNQSDWESFKREFNHDMDKLAQALNDITVNNKG